jgi:hypothetical protein
LAIEHKSWLDLSDRSAQANLAKAAIAIANYGGGIIVFGMRGDDAVAGLLSRERPDHIGRYRQDDINAAINRYADPQLHCSLEFAVHPESGVEHTFAIIPGEERVPNMSRRETNGIIEAQRCYVRKPGPRSEEPYTSAEWRPLFDRCIRTGREEMLDAIRLIVEGRAGELPVATAMEALDAFSDESRERWRQLTTPLAADDVATFPNGRYEMSFEIEGFEPLRSLLDLRARLDRAGELRHTGWGPFVSISRPELAPRPVQDAIEAWVGLPDPDRFQRDAGHCDYWRVNRDGKFFLLRGYQEDDIERARPGTLFDVTLPVWRIGEALLYLSRFAREEEANPAITVRVRYFGLEGRSLTSVSGRRFMTDHWKSADDEAALAARATAQEMDENLSEVLYPMLVPLYERFNFFELPRTLVTEELAEMRKNRF